MAEKKKDKVVLVKVSDLEDDELDAKLDQVLDSLFGPDEDMKVTKNSKSTIRKAAVKKPKPAKSSEKQRRILRARRRSKI